MTRLALVGNPYLSTTTKSKIPNGHPNVRAGLSRSAAVPSFLLFSPGSSLKCLDDSCSGCYVRARAIGWSRTQVEISLLYFFFHHLIHLVRSCFEGRWEMWANCGVPKWYMYNSLTQSLLLCVVVSLGLLAPISDHNIRTETNEKNVKRKHKYVIRKFISLRNFLPLLSCKNDNFITIRELFLFPAFISVSEGGSGTSTIRNAFSFFFFYIEPFS